MPTQKKSAMESALRLLKMNCSLEPQMLLASAFANISIRCGAHALVLKCIGRYTGLASIRSTDVARVLPKRESG